MTHAEISTNYHLYVHVHGLNQIFSSHIGVYDYGSPIHVDVFIKMFQKIKSLCKKSLIQVCKNWLPLVYLVDIIKLYEANNDEMQTLIKERCSLTTKMKNL